MFLPGDDRCMQQNYPTCQTKGSWIQVEIVPHDNTRPPVAQLQHMHMHMHMHVSINRHALEYS